MRLSEQKTKQRSGARPGRSLPTTRRRSLAQIAVAVRYLQPFFRELRTSGPLRGGLGAPVHTWAYLREHIAATDALFAKRLEDWAELDIDAVVNQLTGSKPDPHTVVWRFERRLTCSIVEDARRWFDVIVDTHDQQYLRERFKDRHDAFARAESLKMQLQGTSWREIVEDDRPE